MDTKTTPTKPLSEALNDELLETIDEELELEFDDQRLDFVLGPGEAAAQRGTLDRRTYFRELLRLQRELIKLQDWVVHQKLKLVVLFEGRDAAGKGGVIKRITQRLNPRVCRVVALPAPTDRERTQWYFQRYVDALAGGPAKSCCSTAAGTTAPASSASWASAPRPSTRSSSAPCRNSSGCWCGSGIILVKYWFSITDEEQNMRFLMRIHDPLKQWKLSPMDLESRRRWEEYTKAKEEMLERTHIPESPLVGGARRSTRSARDSTACIICCSRCPTKKSPTTRSICPSASTNRIIRGILFRRICTFRQPTSGPEDRLGEPAARDWTSSRRNTPNVKRRGATWHLDGAPHRRRSAEKAARPR